MIRHTFLLFSTSLILATYADQNSNDKCRSCDAFGLSRRPDSSFTHRDGCREYNCQCACSGRWECPTEQITDICKSDTECRECWAGNEARVSNRPFKFTEDCYRYSCFCACDGAWNCPKEDTVDICNTNVDTGCHYCDVGGERHEGNSRFKHVNGCIEYECVCKCDGAWDCPGEHAIDTCKSNPDTGCYYCEVGGEKHEGNTYFKHVNGCIEYHCSCNCDGSWDCPGERARDTCRQNHTTQCYYCEIDGYLFQGNSNFDLVRNCYKYTGCTCDCDGGWTCEHTTGNYICDQSGRELSDCNTCAVEGKEYRGETMFSLDRDCVKYICTCDCNGKYYCPAENARVTCEEGYSELLVSLSSGVFAASDHTRAPRQVGGDKCRQCYVSDHEKYEAWDQFTIERGCNRFECICRCNGSYDCPSSRTVNICNSHPTGGGTISGGGLDATSAGSRSGSVAAIGRGSVLSTNRHDDKHTAVNVCRKCEYLGVSYEGNSDFTFEKGCFQYNCFCDCNGGFKCPSEGSQYICEGRKECVRCDLTDYNAGFKDPNTDFQIRRGCDLFDKCRCNCDGGWSCEDGVYACELKSGCEADGRKYATDTTFELTRGCDKYKACVCYADGHWDCERNLVEDLCGQCRKCKIGNEYYDGDTSFVAQVGCTSYRQCVCRCDGSYECIGGRYTCDARSDQPPEGQCTDCTHDGRTYRNGQSFDYSSGSCHRYRGCECRCGETTCREMDDTCGDCRSCNVDGIDYPGGSEFASKQGCYEYSRCKCNCNGRWECFGDSAKDTCNKCRKCNVEGKQYDEYSKFKLDRKCWNYQCFCLCNGTTWCPSATVVNTCNVPSDCQNCDVDGRNVRGNTHFTHQVNGMDLFCRCNCDSSYVCVAEWLYIREDVSISGSGIGSGLGDCFTCLMDGRTYRGDSKYTITRSGITMDCACNCNGGYSCYGEQIFEYHGCRSCSLYGQKYNGDSSFPLIYNGLKISCQCSCDGGYVCYGARSEVIITCIGGSGCVSSTCGQCMVDGVRFNGGDQFGTVYKGQNLVCNCGCDQSYYCEGLEGMIISCVRGRCTELGCSSCDVYGTRYEGGAAFELYYNGLRLGCQCECGGSYQCFGANREIIVSCVDGSGCLTGNCRTCAVNNRQYVGLDTFRYQYNGIDMLCYCACDSSYYCEGVSELIQISCIGGQCTRIDCSSCSVFGLTYEGDSSFDVVYSGLKLQCQCSCDSGYRCYGSSSTTAIVTCLGGRGTGCLPSTCRPCLVDSREYAGRSNFRSAYKGIDVMCTCGCDSTSYCVGITTSIEVTCADNVCTRVGCNECSIFRKEYIGGSQFDIIYQGLKAVCECDCSGGYVCRGATGTTITTCVDGYGPGCLLQRCNQCEVNGRRYEGWSSFTTVYQGIAMNCVCSCDTSYYCEGIREKIQISCIRGKCTTFGCKTCNLFGKEHDGASLFKEVYAGLLLNCQCSCNGHYVCRGEQDSLIIQCRDGRGNCLDQQCRTCEMGGERHAARSKFRYQYEGMEVSCTCGCDSSVYCVGVSTQITISCISGKCSTVGCANCRIFGQQYTALSSFEMIYSGYRINCRCGCGGGYSCTGKATVDCQENRLSDCLPETCGRCSLDGQQYNGRSVFKYKYNNIDVSCTCGCDGSIFCQGVTEIIELRCIAGLCYPEGCRTCSILGREYTAFSEFNFVHHGLQLTCRCSCDSGYVCLGSSGSRDLVCTAGSTCLPNPCRDCILDGRHHTAGSEFAHTYKNIAMLCNCGCDGSSYCEGTEEVIYVSCIGEHNRKSTSAHIVYATCTPVGCKSCSLFGQDYAGDSSFDIVYKGVEMDCSCNCDTSYRCVGTTTDGRFNCGVGTTCVPRRCKKCRVNGKRYDGGSTFQMDYQGIRMSCVCGCDTSYFCRGISTDIEISCQRKGGCKLIGGCRSCNIFGREYAGGSKTDFVHQGYFMNCECRCDSSYKCLGIKNEVIIECSPGQDCLSDRCGTCRIDGREFRGNSQFDHTYNGKNMRCTCGCDGSYFCRCKDDSTEISCNRRGDCSWIGCNTCLADGRQRQAFEEFEKYYDGIRMSCVCNCDSSYRCAGVEQTIIIVCTGDSCNLQGCRSCMVDGREYPSNSDYEIARGSHRQRCRCECDGRSECTTIVKPSCVSCTIDGVTYKGHSRQRVYKGSTSYICDCFCNGEHDCYPEQSPRCEDCEIGGRRHEGNTNFETILEGTRMQCACDCKGKFVCKSDFRTCSTTSGCVDTCNQCVIDDQHFKAAANFQANVFGLRMTCTCDCTGSYSCHSETRICTSTSGCTDNCRKCIIDNQSFNRNSDFQATVFGLQMQCACECTGRYSCRSESRICSSESGCVDNCRQCSIDGQRFQPNSNFQATVFGFLMQCTCECNGGYTCRSERRTCSSESGCVDNCRQCSIDGQRFQPNSNFQATVFGFLMQCTCECNGGYTCRSDTRTCTLTSGCVDNCRQCIIDRQRFEVNSNFQASVYGTQMECSCSCSGDYSCRSDTRICTSQSGCKDTCQQCVVNGRSYTGYSEFDTILEGTRMRCTCDCRGGYECRGGTYICTHTRGCISQCEGCDIEGQVYAGNSKFDIFHNAYDIKMSCECECGGSYKCKGTKEITSCIGSGCPERGCNDCIINNVNYRGSTQFEAMIDGYRMKCTCSCSGGYRCTGTRTETDCYGPGCAQADGSCTDCVIRGRSYNTNSQFEITGEDGIRLLCVCDCIGQYSCKGEKTTTVCVGAGCDTGCSSCYYYDREYRGGTTFEIIKEGVRLDCACACTGEVKCEGSTRVDCEGPNCVTGCSSCNYYGREYRGGTTFEIIKEGVRLDCACACTGEVKCEGSTRVDCEGPNCVTGCRRCVIDGRPYTGNTRFSFSKGSLEYACVCYCDGSYVCKGSTGLDTSCVGESCAADDCRSCRLFDREYSLDATFRLQKNNLVMNCVCECDGAYRCFSISGTCALGDTCDDYGCKSCTVEGKVFAANSQFTLSTGSICICQCNGEYNCRAKSLHIECVGDDCGVGSGCQKCKVDGNLYTGNKRFQLRKYGLLMHCACNCDSSFTCRGYQIISEGETPVDTGCNSCEINGRSYNGNTRFQLLRNGERSVCSCDCDGRYSCDQSNTECRECVIGGQRYSGNSDFTLTMNENRIRCRCGCVGNFVCEGRGDGTCFGNECVNNGCKECLIFGVRHKGDTKFTTDVRGIRMLCECLCTSEYTCRGYRHVTNVILPAKEEKTCQSCYVADTEHPGNRKFKIQRGCFQIECVCNCDGLWECPEQEPAYTCSGGQFDTTSVTQKRYSITGSHVFTTGQVSSDSKQSTLIYTGEETSSTVFGTGGDCRSCFINENEYSGNTEFVLQDGCLRWSCKCDCRGGWNCSAVSGSECQGPLSPFEHKQCMQCTAFGSSYPPNQRFNADDECYRYDCFCECDGSWECPRELTVKTCSDTSKIYDPDKGTCRQCLIGTNTYNFGDTFDIVDNCINYKCQCRCNGSYICPASTAVRVCRSGSGSAGRPVTTGSNTITQSGRTVVAIRPSGYGNGHTYSSSDTRTAYSSTTGSNQRTVGTSSSSSRGGSHSSSSRMYETGSGGSEAGSGRLGTSSTADNRRTVGTSTGSSYSTGGSSSASSSSSSGAGSGSGYSGRVYRIQASRGSGSHSGAGAQSGSSYTSGTYGSSSGEGYVDLTSLLSGGRCQNCVVNGQSLKGGRDFTFTSGCVEHLCECFCNGTHYCDPEDQINFCEEDRARSSNTKPQGCTVGSRTYMTKLFSYQENCLKYKCRCFDNGSYNCDSTKTKKVC